MKKLLIGLTVLSTIGFIGCDGGLSNDVTRKTITAEKAIENYEWFKQQEEDIKAKYNQEVIARKSIKNFMDLLPKESDKWTPADRHEISRLRTILDGTEMQVNQMVADYNARVNMKHRAVFKDNLPTNIFRGTDLRLEYKYGIDVYNQSGN
ncbi:MAG: hypothetical protein ACRC92_20210 [Peptostreptococcaceae bacterium]